MSWMIRYLLFTSLVLHAGRAMSQKKQTTTLHIQVYDEGVCLPMLKSNFYNTTKYQQTKSILQSGLYFSTILVYLNSLDSADLNPQTNHLLQSSSIQFNPTLDYELVFLRSHGFNRSSPDSMVIKISKLDKDAQLLLPFKKGEFKLKKMKHYSELKNTASPHFNPEELNISKPSLKLDSTAFFANGRIKAKYFMVDAQFPLYYVQEYDSSNPATYAQGYHLLTNYKIGKTTNLQSVWANRGRTKYGYWEYFEKNKRIKHELWAAILQQKFEWFPAGQLKFATHYGHANKEIKHTYYLENGAIKEEFHMQSASRNSFIKQYIYAVQGHVVLINTYSSKNGITTQGLQKRELFYPSGKHKMVENFQGTYAIKYYNKDGTERTH